MTRESLPSGPGAIHDQSLEVLPTQSAVYESESRVLVFVLNESTRSLSDESPDSYFYSLSNEPKPRGRIGLLLHHPLLSPGEVVLSPIRCYLGNASVDIPSIPNHVPHISNPLSPLFTASIRANKPIIYPLTYEPGEVAILTCLDGFWVRLPDDGGKGGDCYWGSLWSEVSKPLPLVGWEDGV
ncbi:hypothetical protein Tco_0204847 [Tanacetum coccineum]